MNALRNEEEPLSGDAERVLFWLTDRPLASTDDCVSSMDLPGPRVRDALRELRNWGLLETDLLGWTRPRVARIRLPDRAIRRLGIPSPTWHDEGNLGHLLQRLPLVENFYQAAGSVELGPVERFQWISGRSLDAAVDYRDGWVAIFWSGLLEKESSISARLEDLGQDLLDLASTGEDPFPARFLIVVEDWWQRCLVQRAVRHLPMAEELVDIWCIADGDCPGIKPILRGRGRISQPVPARGTGKWPWAARVESSPWSKSGNLALGKVLNIVAQFSEARAELVKELLQEGETERGAQRSLSRLLNEKFATRRWDGKSYLYRPASAGYDLLARRDGVSAPVAVSDEEHTERPGRDLQKHEDGWRSLIGLWAAAGALVASGERSWEDMGNKGGGISPDWMAHLSTIFGLSRCYGEYELSARGEVRITKKLKGYSSRFRQDGWPVMAVCYNDSAERIFHDVGRRTGLPMLTTTVQRLEREGPWRCWSWYGSPVEVSLPGITTASFARRLMAWLVQEQAGLAMDEGDFQRLCDAYAGSDSLFRRAFGHRKWWSHTREYLMALLVQSQGRSNAGNASEREGWSPRPLHRFPSKEGWNDEATIDRLQRYLAGRLSHPVAAWEVYGGDSPEHVREDEEVTRGGRGTLAGVADVQSGLLLAYSSPLGRALVDKRLYLPEAFTSDSNFCAAVGVPKESQIHRSRPELALEMLDAARALAQLEAGWVAGDDIPGKSNSFREALTGRDLRYVLNVGADTKVSLLPRSSSDPALPDSGRLHMYRTAEEHQRTMQEHADAMPRDAWREISVTEGGRGSRNYAFAARRAQETRIGERGEGLWAIWRRDLDGGNPHCYLSNAPWDASLETLALFSRSRWLAGTDIEAGQSNSGLDLFEACSWSGWHHRVDVFLLAGALLLSMQQDYGASP